MTNSSYIPSPLMIEKFYYYIICFIPDIFKIISSPLSPFFKYRFYGSCFLIIMGKVLLRTSISCNIGQGNSNKLPLLKQCGSKIIVNLKNCQAWNRMTIEDKCGAPNIWDNFSPGDTSLCQMCGWDPEGCFWQFHISRGSGMGVRDPPTDGT